MVMDEKIRSYRSKDRRRFGYILILCLVVVVTFLFCLPDPRMSISFGDSIQILIDHINGVKPETFQEMIRDRLVVEENIPRALGAIMAGAVLSVCGAVLQSLIRNPLADPYTLGISTGALFGMVLFVGLGISVVPFITTDDALIVNAFVLSLIPTAIVVVISVFKKVTPTMMILCGIAVMYIFNAFNIMIKYTVEPEKLSMIYQWSIGSVSGMSWGSLPKLAIAVCLVSIPMFYLRNRIDIVSQGDNQAITLGIVPNRLRIFSLVIVSLSTALVVCYTGTIGFVGLVAPHIARIFVGSRNKLLIPASAVIGALMVLGCDLIVRYVASRLPVGAVLALFCSPIFIIILIRMKKEVW
jgi:iron complex transport system permease protein/cobaltochelatase CobN